MDEDIRSMENHDSIPAPVDVAEIDRVLVALGQLMETVASDGILEILEDACCDVADLAPETDEPMVDEADEADEAIDETGEELDPPAAAA